MLAPAPSLLDSAALGRRLRELAGDERNVQVDFLLHLAEFDRRRAYLEAGHGSLWDWCLKVLHLREGAAGRRIAAMRALRRHPRLEAPMRDGRLCLSTAALLSQVLTDENLDALVGRAAYRTRAEVDHLVASLHPRSAPKDGVRALAVLSQGPESSAAPTSGAWGAAGAVELALGPAGAPVEGAATGPIAPVPTIADISTAATPAAPPTPAAVADVALRPQGRRSELRPVSESLWSVRVTIDRATKDDLELLTMLLSHTVPSSDLAAVLREAIRCGLEKHGKRKGAIAPAHPRRAFARPASGAAGRIDSASLVPEAAPSPDTIPIDLLDPRSSIPIELRRAVWARDGGCCAWIAGDGTRCGSRWQLELDHIVPVALGGLSILANLRLLCRQHNLLHAEQVFGREFMARFRASTAATATP